jgi:hypothetical protein
MIIDDKRYKLTTNNYFLFENVKTQIVLGHTSNHDMNHFVGWVNRLNGYYNKTAAFTIDAAGFIYKHFDPKYQSNYFVDKSLNDKSIVILLENDGWVENNVNNELISWNGDIYKGINSFIDIKWRGHEKWCTYSEEQLNSVSELIKELGDNFNIPLKPISHNTKLEGVNYDENVLYQSNLDKNCTSLSPAWDCIKLKKIIKNKDLK